MAFLATFEDANAVLDETKIRFVDADDAEPEARQADVIVRSALVDAYEDAFEWGDGKDIPALTKVIAGYLMGSIRYGKKYSEESVSESSYAAVLWRRAMELIEGIRMGTLELEGTESGIAFTRANFHPNDLTTFPGTDKPLRYFEMEKMF